MLELLTPIVEPIKPLLDNLAASLPFIIFLVLIVVLSTYSCVRVLVALGTRWRMNAKKYGGTRRWWGPKNWKTLIHLQPKHLHKAQTRLLKSRGIREFYAPAAHYMEEREDKRLYFRNAWLSPHPSAVKTSVTEHKHELKGKHLKARQQIGQAAKWAKALPLPEDVYIGGSEKEKQKHLLVELGLNNHRQAEVERLWEDVKSALSAESYEPYRSGKYDRLSMIFHQEPPIDILIERKFGVEFFNENLAKSPYSVPLAIRRNGKPWNLDVHHTLIYGMTGAGKGGPIQGTIRQLAPFVKEGRVQLFGIDPKGPELGPYAKKGVQMFERISIGLAEENIRQHVKTINQVAAIIAHRGNNIEPDFREGKEDLKRESSATKENPWVVVIIDEYLTLINGLKKLGREGAPAIATLEQILATGRAFGIYVVMATQVATKEVFGNVRDNIPNIIVLKHKASPYWTTEFLGEEALEEGHDPKKIGPSNKANNYETAGIGYVSTAAGIEKIRFGYLSDKDIVEVAKQFMDDDADLSVFDEPVPEFDPKDYGLDFTQEEAEALDKIFDDEDEGGFKISEASTPEEDGLKAALKEL